MAAVGGMSDADRLRRAAAELREYAKAAAAGPWKTGGGYFRPWELVIASDLPLVEFANDHGGASTAEYVALLHPPVALAFANLLTCISYMPSASNQTDMVSALEAADAVLREDAS